MRPILMSSSSSSSQSSLHSPQLQSLNKNSCYDNSINHTTKTTTDDCSSSNSKSNSELNKNHHNNNLNENNNSRLEIYCTLRSPQKQHHQQQHQQPQQSITIDSSSDDQTLKDWKNLNWQQENHHEINSKNINLHHYNSNNNIAAAAAAAAVADDIYDDDDDVDEDNLKLLDNNSTKKELSMLSKINKIEDQHEFDLNDDVSKSDEDSNYYVGSSNNSSNNNICRDSDYNNGKREIFRSTAFLRLKDKDENLVELPYPVQPMSSSSDEQISPSTYQLSSGTNSSTKNPLDILSYCTMSKKLKQMIAPSQSSTSSSNIFHHNTNTNNNNSNSIYDLSYSSSNSTINLPYQKLKESKTDLIADDLKYSANALTSSITTSSNNNNNYGLSNNLSTESLKNSCDCYDLTDDDNDDSNFHNKILDNKNEFSNNTNRHDAGNSLKRNHLKPVIGINNKASSSSSSCSNNSSNNNTDNNKNIKFTKQQQNSQQIEPPNKKSSKIVNNCLLQKLENRLNELKKYEKNSSISSKSNLIKTDLKSQSLDRKRNSTNFNKANHLNNITNNNNELTMITGGADCNSSGVSFSADHPSYCTMKRDKNTNITNFTNQNYFQFDFEPENKTISLPSTSTTIKPTTTIVTTTNTTINDDNQFNIIDDHNSKINYCSESSINPAHQQQQQQPLQQHTSLTTEAFNILNELDEILANTETAISEGTATINNSSDEELADVTLDFDFNYHKNQHQDNNNLLLDGKISPIQSETTTEKIEDCLFELDEYLDEIDRQTPKLYRDSSEDDYIDNRTMIEWFDDDDDDDEYCNQETLKRSKTLPKKLLRRQFLNTDTNADDDDYDTIITDRYNDRNLFKDKKFMTIDRKVELLQRGHILRNTIAGLRHKIAKVKLKQNDSIESKQFSNKIIIQSNLCDHSKNNNGDSSTPGTPVNSSRKAWRRNSMRKTSLINLPDNCENNSLPLPLLPPISPLASLFINHNNNGNSSGFRNNLNNNSQQNHPLSNAMDPFNNLNQCNILPQTSEFSTNSTSNHQIISNSLPDDVNINSDIRRTLSYNDCRQQQQQTEQSRFQGQQLDNLNNLDLVHDILNNATLQDTSSTTNDNENFGNISSTSENSNLIQQQNTRPRQIGRRAEAHPRILSITAETTGTGQRIIVNHDRPVSAPAATGGRQAQTINSPLSGILPNTSILDAGETNRNAITADNSQQQHHHQHQHQQSRFIGSEASSIGSSRNPSPVSIISSTGSSSLNSTNTENQTNSESHHHQTTATGNAVAAGTRTSPLDPDLNFQVQSNAGINSFWPHSFSRILALLCCTLGLFNISRFSVLTVHYGGNFLIQFLILSIIFGIPMFWLQMCLGSKIRSGPVSMWKISPICRGIGISLCLAQCVIAIYSTISLAWILVYFRDSFVKRDEYYKWQEAFYIYRRQVTNYTSTNLTETIADYFNGVVLQRWQLGLGRRIETGGVRFQLAFNLAIIWALVFIILCKGLKSFGKIVLSLTVIPLVLFFVVTCQLLYIIDFSSVQNIFSASDFEDFLINSKTWIAAAQETFLTWVLLSPSVISITSRSTEKDVSKTVLRRDAIVVVLLTLFGLSLAAVFGFACIQILQNYDYLYLPGTYENMDSYLFLFNHKTLVSPILASIPIKWIPHYSSVLGETYRRHSAASQFRESGYEPLRLCTELFPAVVAVAQDQISSVFTVLGFLAFLFFGLAQLCAIWKPISSALGNSSSSVLLSCVTGLLLGIPFATEMGLSIIHYLDLIIGGAWWLPILWTAQIFGVFLIRGRPYNGDLLVNDLKMAGSMSAFLALSWNVLLPIGLVSLAVIQYKVSGSNQFYYWRGKSYFNFWTRKVGGLIQVGFLLIVPLTAIIQIYRYLNKGPPDILDRIQNLYRPTQSPLPSRRPRPTINRPTSGQSANIGGTGTNNANTSSDAQNIQDDAPPKYTPPPSYTTATGARLAKIFRQSIRRSVRRILGETSRTRPTLHTSPTIENHLPPEYSTVLTDPAGLNSTDNENIEIGPRILYNSNTNRNLSSLERQRRRFTDTNIEIINHNQAHNTCSTNNRPSSAEQTSSSSASARINFLPFSASDVAQVLRTNRHERSASALATRVVDHALRSSSLRCKSSRSVENLVLNAAPLGESSAIALNFQNNDNDNNENRDSEESTSVI